MFSDWKDILGTLFGLVLVIGIIFWANSGPDMQEQAEEISIAELEEKVEELEKENQELKYKLDNINTMASDRDYYWVDLLDDIESESAY